MKKLVGVIQRQTAIRRGARGGAQPFPITFTHLPLYTPTPSTITYMTHNNEQYTVDLVRQVTIVWLCTFYWGFGGKIII